VTRDDDADGIAVVNEPGWSPNDVARVSRGIRASHHRPAAAFRRVSAPFLLRLVNPRKKKPEGHIATRHRGPHATMSGARRVHAGNTTEGSHTHHLDPLLAFDGNYVLV
jgi:hypothetical protein